MKKNNKQLQIAGKDSKQYQINNLNVFLQNFSNNELYQNLLNGKDCFSLSLLNEVITETTPLNLDELEKINLISIFNSSLVPWKRSYGLLFGSVCGTEYCIDPYVKVGTTTSNENKLFSKIKSNMVNHNCIVLGEAGFGKSFIMKKTCIDLLTNGNHALYLSAQDWNNSSIFFNYFDNVLNHRIMPPENLLIILDGIDEIFATNHKALAQLINKANTVKCTIWFGCRTDYYDSAQCLDAIPYQRVYLQAWDPQQSLKYVEEHNKKLNNNILQKYLSLVKQNDCIESFLENPLRLSMLIYILENDKKNTFFHNNEYLLYSEFFSQWISNEFRRSADINLDEEDVFSDWQRIARIIYSNPYSEITVSNNSVLISILKVTKSSPKNYKVNDFWHRSFIEFLLAKEAVDSMQKSSHDAIQKLRFNNRSDVDRYIKKAFAVLSPYQKDKIIDNLIYAYDAADNESLSENEYFYVQNQIVYYLTRMYSSSKRIKSFIEKIYTKETRPIMQQGIAYGAANIGLLDIALNFAKKMDNPNSPENSTNRAWTLIFYGDQPDEDPLEYEDSQNALWKRSKEARLRRLRGNNSKDHAFRMFDLCILHGFFESRGWHEMTKDDLKIIQETETNINGFNQEVIDFIVKKKQDLVNMYNKSDTRKE